MKKRGYGLVFIAAIFSNIAGTSMLAQEDLSTKEEALMPSVAAKQVDLDIKNEYVVSLFIETLKAIDDASRDLEDIMEALREGKIAMWNNKGVWMAVLEKGTILKNASFSSEDMNSRVTSIRKNVWAKPDYEEEIHEKGYVIEYDDDGKIKSYWTRGRHRTVRFHANGKARRFDFVLDKNVRGFLVWDENGAISLKRIPNEATLVGVSGTDKDQQDQ
jgi:hypothetical protein